MCQDPKTSPADGATASQVRPWASTTRMISVRQLLCRHPSRRSSPCEGAS
ncbi:unnamed protein product [Symbiodinium sp. KB8]|nr:unnamed protein product [Symbiodinium sp. KB8]